MLPMLQSEPALNCAAHSGGGHTTPSPSLPPPLTPESEADDLVFFDIDVAIERIGSSDIQLGDTWRGMQDKMSVSAPVKKIRKKPDNKPQSQLNKCHNEKRRRELENETINQLEELLGTCLAEVKQPDKNGIVREATRQIQEVLKRRRECPAECPSRQRALPPPPPLQGGEVSSTQPQQPGEPLRYSEITSLIEALKHYTSNLGWVLLEINSDGDIVCVTDNIKELVYQEKTQLHKTSIFSLLDVDDHSKIRPLLTNIQSFSWGTGDIDKFEAVHAKLLIPSVNGRDGHVEALIHAAGVRSPSSEAAGSVMCVIRRCEDASAATCPADGALSAVLPNKLQDHLVFRLDTNLTIISCDLSGLEDCANYNTALVNTPYLELVEACDRARVAAHLQSAACLPAPPAVCEPYRLRLRAAHSPLRVTARSRLFLGQPDTLDPDFIMSTHTVLADDDVALVETGVVPGPCPAAVAVGGPLMTSASASRANGESSAAAAAAEPRYVPSPADSPFMNEFDLDPWSSLEAPRAGGWRELGDMEERKEAGSPLTPRTPATPAEPPPPPPQPEEPNRLRSLLSSRPGDRILKGILSEQEEDEATSSESSQPHTPHTPLTPAPHHHHAHAQHNDGTMLLRILNEKSDEDGEESCRRGGGGGGGGGGGHSLQQSALLTQLLSTSNGPSNGRSQEASDYLDRMAAKRKMDDARGQPPAKRSPPPLQQQVSSSGAPSATPSSLASSMSAGSPAGGSGMSSLCQKNQILVSLLAKQQSTPPPPPGSLRGAFLPGAPTAARARPPPHPHPHPQQHPRHHHSTLSNILANHPRTSVNGSTSGAGAPAECSTAGLQSHAALHGAHQSQLHMVLQSGARAPYPLPAGAPPHYANPNLHMYNNQQGGSNQRQGGMGLLPNDQALSDILDTVLDNMPDADRAAPEVAALLGLETRQPRPDYTHPGMKEENDSILRIKQTLMQCEKVTKIPVSSSPGAPPVYPVQSPGGCNIGGGMYQAQAQAAAAAAAAAGARGDSDSRARALQEQQRARLLQMQRTQQMHVSPEAEVAQGDLGSTINALVNSGNPPNVSLTRTDYHHLYHQTNQIGSNYGTNKITSSQQNPMLSRQLSASGGSGGGSGAGYAHGTRSPAASPAALHTPLAAHPRDPAYLRQPPPPPPRPQLVGGYYDESGGYCAEYTRRAPPHQPHAHPAHPAHHDPGAGGGGGTSEYVRNELRNVVGARSSRPDLHQAPADLDPLLNFDMTSVGAGAGAGASAGAARAAWEPPPAASTTEAVTAAAAAAAGGDSAAGSKASLLQKLLSQ